MNYQVALTISYIFRLVNELGDYSSPNYSRLRCDSVKALAVPESTSSVNYQINVVNIQDKFYIQDSKQNLHFIQKENANKLPNNFIKNLNTLIHFEKFKKRPIDSMIYFKKIINSNIPCIDFDLLSKLQLQFATDPSYFDS